MPCYKPLDAYRAIGGGITFKRSESAGIEQKLACGQCIGCRLDRSRDWAIRCMHETTLHEDNCFITLTYSPEHLPEDGQLEKIDFQKFIRALRKNTGQKIRYYHCGEYGAELKRPHFHAILFGYRPGDLELFKMTEGMPLYTSETISKAWQHKGYATIGDATFESAAYVARYIMKKQNGESACSHYVDPATGISLNPEYTTMSLKPGIGAGYYEKYKNEIFPHDRVILKGKEMPPPKYYLSKYEVTNPEEFEKIKAKRKANNGKRSEDQTPERLATRETVAKARLTQLKRHMESQQ